MRDGRPDPDDLLKAVQKGQRSRGRLKVFLGAAPGVGKTYAMLSEAQESLKRGVDVVVGYAECHRRAETQSLLAELEQIAMRNVPYRETNLLEVDVTAILERRPEIVLIDELAHTNAPGLRHTKRWQDVTDILEAGISVFTAVNIQHLESLNDVVAQVTGVRVQETVPDSFFDDADEIELIDLPSAELRKRLEEGKVYVPERIDQALEGFFKSSNLTALRELALRRAADTVDAEVQRLRVQEGTGVTWATRERMLVCIAPNQMGQRVIRAAARLSAANHAEKIALYVESDRQSTRPQEDHERVRESLQMAEELGFEVVSLVGHDIVGEILAFARKRNATLIVVGKPIRPRWMELLFGSVVDELVRASGDIDVHVITFLKNREEPRARHIARSDGLTAKGLAVVTASVSLATLLGFGLFASFGLANTAMVYILGLALAAMWCNRLESSILSLASVLAFNFCFVEPRFSFAVSDLRYLLLFGVMLFVGLVISTLTHRLRSQLAVLSERERRTASLYALSRQLAQGRNKRDLAAAAAKEIRSVFDGDVAIWILDQEKPHIAVQSDSQFERNANEFAVAAWVSEHNREAGRGTDTLPGACAVYLPLRGPEGAVGVLAFKPNRDFDNISQRQLLTTFATGLGLAIERANLAKQSNESKLQAERERMRNTLLSSISHDLRTPLTSIAGAASSLASDGGNTKLLAETIYSESMRLNQQIQNLLDMTWLHSGEIHINRTWESPEELMASAIAKSEPALKGIAVEVGAKGQSKLLMVDGLLVEKALVNLIENAARYAGPGGKVNLSGWPESDRYVFLMQDNGPGIPPEALGRLFVPGFHTESGGFGMGLAIVDAIVKLHGGKATATNMPKGGAAFRLEFPLPEKQPEVPVG